MGTNLIRALARWSRRETARFLLLLLLLLLLLRLASLRSFLYFFRARVSFFYRDKQESSHADPSSVFVRVVTYITDVRFARGERGLRGVLRVFRRAVSRGHGIRLFAFSQS